MTMASSTTNPVAMVSAISVRLLMLNPARYMTPKVPIRDSGTTIPGMIVARTLRKNKNMIITTSATDSINSKRTSATEARMVVVRSVRILTLMDSGRVACNCGRIWRMRSTVSITLAPGWRRMLKMTAGVWSAQAARCAFSAPSIVSAMSLRRIGAPPRQATIRLRYSSADFS